MTNSNNPRSGGDVAGTLLLSWLTAIGLLGALVWFADPWEVLAITRLLDPFIEAGLVQYHDTQLGYVPGIPDIKWFLWSQDPIDWRLVLASAALLVAVAPMRAIQFREVLSRCGVSCDAHLAWRSFLIGQGRSRWMPFNAGDVSTILSLKANGVDAKRATQALYLMRVLWAIELCIFAVIGLFALGWMPWLLQAFWALVILAAAWLALRPHAGAVTGWGTPATLRGALATLTSDAPSFLRLILLAAVTFVLEHVAVFVMAMAFTTVNVLLNIPFSLFLMALVSGFVARLIPVTPGGLGQFEWAFAAALYFGGISLPMAASTALLFMVLRYAVAFGLDLLTRTGISAPDHRAVMAVLAGRKNVEDAAG